MVREYQVNQASEWAYVRSNCGPYRLCSRIFTPLREDIDGIESAI